MKWKATLSALPLLLLTSAPVIAGPYTDDMAKCFVRNSQVDSTLLTTWIFGVISLHPDVVQYSRMTDEQRDGQDKAFAGMIERLLLESCRSETADAIRLEGSQSVDVAFRALGEVAGRQLLTEQAIAESTAGITRYLDTEKLKGLTALPTKAE